METSCVFCFAEANKSSSESEVRREEYWPYIRPSTWKGNPPLQTPPMCTTCSEKIEEIAKCHREIVKLEQKLYMIRKQLDEAAKDVRETMEKCTTNQKSDQKIDKGRKKRSKNVAGAKRSFREMMMASFSTGGESAEIKLAPYPMDDNIVGGGSSKFPIGDTSSNEIGVPASNKLITSSETKNDTNPSNCSEEEGDDFEYKLENPTDYSESETEDLMDPLEDSNFKMEEQSDSDSEMTPPNRVVKRRPTRPCALCGMRLPIADLYFHMRDHVGDYAFQCKSCSITSPSRYSYSYYLVNHRKMCPDLNLRSRIKCELCGTGNREFKYGYALKHVLDKHENQKEKNFTCPLPSCGETFTWKQSLELHLGDHEITSKNNRMDHLRKHSNSSRQTCVICGLKFPTSDLYEHVRGHVGEYAFQCQKCLVTFASRLSLAYYGKNHRNKCGITKKPFNCEVCGEKRENKQKRDFTHFQKHETLEKNFTCPLPSCGKGFTWKQTLEIHLGEHENTGTKTAEKLSRNYDSYRGRSRNKSTIPCEICGESFPVENSKLHEHLESHVGDLAFQCPMASCRLSFASRYTRACGNFHRGQGHDQPRSTCSWMPPKICEECNEQFENLVYLRQHLRGHEASRSEKNFTCPITNCGKGFTIKQSLEFHLTLHWYLKDLQICTICPSKEMKRFSPDEMEQHLRDLHRVQSVIRCPYCPFAFPSESQEDLVDHVASHAQSGSGIKCHLCSTSSEKVFEYAGTLRKHFLEEHQIGRRYLCESCDFSCATVKVLGNHVRKIHGKEGQCKKYICEICEDKPTFMYSASLTSHNITMHNGAKFQCNICLKGFTSKGTLMDHEKHVHGGEERQKFPCPQCDMMFLRKSGLKGHLANIHSTECHQCSQCEKSYKSVKSLQFHVKSIHEGVKFVCQTCGRGFKAKQLLATHMRIHTGERPYLCKLCGLSFRQQAALYTHSKGHERKGDKFASRGTFDRTPKDTAEKWGIDA